LDIITSIILGFVQGATEFLPVSSSGHLVLAQHLLKSGASSDLIFEVLVHLATMLAVLIYFRKKVLRIVLSLFPPYSSEKAPDLKLAIIIVLATIPAAVIGLLFEDKIEAVFSSSRLTSIMLIVTAAILLGTKFIEKGQKALNIKSGLFIGLAQALALLPGISRSGSTISMALYLKVNPEEAAEYSFLLSLPAVFGAGILKMMQLYSNNQVDGQFSVYLIGALTAFIVGYISIALLLKLVKQGKFFYFGIYCLLVGISGLIFL